MHINVSAYTDITYTTYIPKVYIIIFVILSIKNRQKKRHNALIFFSRRHPRIAGKKFLHVATPQKLEAPPLGGDEQVTPRIKDPCHMPFPYRYLLSEHQ